MSQSKRSMTRGAGPDQPLSRRGVVRLIAGLGASGAAAALLAACGAGTAVTTGSAAAGTVTSQASSAATTAALSSSATATHAGTTAAASSTSRAAGALVVVRAIHWNSANQRPVYDDRLDKASAALAPTGIKVERDWAAINKPYNDKVGAALASGDPFDLMWTDSLNVVPYVQKSALAELSGRVERDKVDLTRLVRGSATLDEYRFGPRLFAFPDVSFAYLMFYNLDLLDKAGAQALGPKATWDEARLLFQRVTQRQGDSVSVYGFENDLGAGTRFMPTMWQFGGDLWQDPAKKTTLGFGSAGTEASMQFMGDLATKFKVMNAAGIKNVSFTDGNMATAYGSSYSVVGADQLWKFRWTAGFPPQQAQRITCTITNGWCIPSSSKRVDAAWQVLHYLGGMDSQTVLVTNDLLSIIKSLNETKAYASVAPEVRQAIFESTTVSRGLEDMAHPVISDWINNDWGPGRTALFTGQKSAKELFDEWQSRYQPQVAAYAALYQ